MTAHQLNVGVVACSRTKTDRPVPARDLYISPLFRAAGTPPIATIIRPGTSETVRAGERTLRVAIFRERLPST